MNKKHLALIVAVLMLVVSMIGCAKPAEDEGKLSGTITVSTLSGDPFQSAWRAKFDEFEAATGVKVIHDAVPWENLREKQALELSNSTSGYDVVYVHPFWFNELASNGYLASLDTYCDAAELDKYVPNLLELYNYEGKQYGLPDWISTQLLAYRTDLFEAAGLEAPKNWADIEAAAAKLANGDEMYGITFPARNAGALAGIFSACLLSNGSWILDENGKPNIDTPEALETAEFMARLSQYAPTGYQNFHWDENATVAATGKAAMIMCMTTNVAWLEDPTRSETVGKWGYVPIANLTQGGMIDSYCWSVAANSQNKAAAEALVKFMGDTDVQVFLTEQMGTAGATKLYYENEELQASHPELSAMNAAFTNAAPNPSWSTWSSEQDVLETGLQKLFNGEITAAEVLKAAQAKMVENQG